jgi:hypothetical protein
MKALAREECMSRGRVAAVMAGAFLAFVLNASPAPGHEQRSGSIGLGLHGQYGGILGPAGFGEDFTADDFDLGGGYGVRLRYATSRSASVGLVFERFAFGAVEGLESPDSLLAPPDELQLIVTGGEYTRYFDRRGKWSQSVLGGIGFYHPTVQTDRYEVFGGTDNVLAWVGAALQYFPRRTVEVELMVRFHGLLGEGSSGGVAVVSLGVNAFLLR